MRKLLPLFLFLWLLTSCTPQEAPTATAAPTAISQSSASNDFVVWGLAGLGSEINAYLTELFETTHPEINVIITDEGWDEALRQNLENAILMGRPPDVVIGENYFRYFAVRGDMQPLDDLIAQHEADLIPATYRAAIYNDHVYAVPFLTGIFGMERNCSVIESAGLDCETPPQYWDEFLDETRRINEAGAGQYFGYTLQGPGGTAVGSAFRIAVYQSQLDALPCSDADCTVADFDNPAVIPVYEFIRELAQYTPPGLIENTNEGEVYEALFRGVSAYQIAGSWHITWARDAGCADCRYSAIPYPRDGHPANLVVGNVLFGAPSNSQHPELALEWLELLLRDDVQAMIFPTTTRLPAKRSTLQALRSEADEATAVFIDELLHNDNIRILPQFGDHPRETWAIYNQLLADVLTTTQPIPEIMQAAQQAVEALD